MVATSIYVFAYGHEGPATAIDSAAVTWRLTDGTLSTLTPLLRGVDPYDDTTFNRLQCSHLRHEVSHLRSQGLDDGDRFVVEELARLVEVVIEGPPHRYLRFNGD